MSCLFSLDVGIFHQNNQHHHNSITFNLMIGIPYTINVQTITVYRFISRVYY